MRAFTEQADGLLAHRHWLLRFSDGRRLNVDLTDARASGGTILARIEGITDRDEAQALCGAEIVVARSELPELSSGEYYWNDLQGLRVVTTDGVALGAVKTLMATGANDVLVVEGDRQRLIPYLPGRQVKGVDLEQGLITVDWDPDF